MRGVSEVIAIILILMITISLAGLAYMFMSTTMSDVTSSAGSTVDITTSSMLTSFTIESMDVVKVYVRNTGQNPLSSMSVYVNDEPATYNVTPASIAIGAVGTITIYSFIPDGATVKITSPSGFSASKIANPCEKAVGCWKFDEGTGTVAYDSSLYGNTGTLVLGPTWTSGRYDGALQFDGSNDYVTIPYSASLDNFNDFTISFWLNSKLFDGTYRDIVRSVTGNNGFLIATEPAAQHIGLWTYNGSSNFYLGSTSMVANQLYFITCVWKKGQYQAIYIDGNLSANNTFTSNASIIRNYPILIAGSSSDFNGTLDEVRIYNRVIY